MIDVLTKIHSNGVDLSEDETCLAAMVYISVGAMIKPRSKFRRVLVYRSSLGWRQQRVLNPGIDFSRRYMSRNPHPLLG